MEKPCRKYALKASSRPLFYFGKHPKQLLHARNSFKNRIFGKRIIKNLLKSQLYFFFRTQSLLMDKVMKKGPGTSDQSFFRLRKKFTKISLIVIYYLTKFDAVI